MTRYDGEPSVTCGALHRALEHPEHPSVSDLREAFGCEGRDRLAALAAVDAPVRPLVAAVVHARLQARRALVHIQDHVPAGPTVWLVVPSVVLNRPDRDTEIVCGIYTADLREPDGAVRYQGLGDDPGVLSVLHEQGRVRITDPEMHEERAARDHRDLVGDAATALPEALAGSRDLEELMARVAAGHHREAPHHGRSILRSLISAALPLAPVPAALVLFAEGLLGIHNLHRVHRLTRDGHQASHDARGMVDELERNLDRLPVERVERALEGMLARHRARRPAPQ